MSSVAAHSVHALRARRAEILRQAATAAALLAATWAGIAAEPQTAAGDTSSTRVLHYQAPSSHPAPRRIGGTARSVTPGLPVLAALVPDHLGLTSLAQPTLYWFISQPSVSQVAFTLIRPGVETPVLEIDVPVGAAGIQAIDLGAHGVMLEPGVEYEWSVAVVIDPVQRSRDIVSGGAIMRVADAGSAASDPAAAADRGLWYDLLRALEQRTRAMPSGADARRQRAALLEQSGLVEVARSERGE